MGEGSLGEKNGDNSVLCSMRFKIDAKGFEGWKFPQLGLLSNIYPNSPQQPPRLRNVDKTT